MNYIIVDSNEQFNLIIDNILKLKIISYTGKVDNSTIDNSTIDNFNCNNLSVYDLKQNIGKYGTIYTTYLKTQDSECKENILNKVINIYIEYIDNLKNKNKKIQNILNDKVDIPNLISSKENLFKDNEKTKYFFQYLEDLNNVKSRELSRINMNYNEIKNYMKETASSKIRKAETLQLRKDIEEKNKKINKIWKGGWEFQKWGKDKWDKWPFWNANKFSEASDYAKIIHVSLSPVYFTGVIIYSVALISCYFLIDGCADKMEELMNGGNTKTQKKLRKKKQYRNRTNFRKRKLRTTKTIF
jgi:hypothetical protein